MELESRRDEKSFPFYYTFVPPITGIDVSYKKVNIKKIHIFTSETIKPNIGNTPLLPPGKCH